VSPGHLLAIPFRHVASFFKATEAEQAALLSLVHDARRLLDKRYAPDGYNIGVNIGPAAASERDASTPACYSEVSGGYGGAEGRGPGGYSGEDGVLRRRRYEGAWRSSHPHLQG